MPKIKRFLVNNPKAIVIPISMDRNPKNAMRFLDKEGISIPLMFGGSDIADSFRIRAIPTTIILDKDRRFLYKIQGQAPWNTKDFRDLMLGFSQRLP